MSPNLTSSPSNKKMGTVPIFSVSRKRLWERLIEVIIRFSGWITLIILGLITVMLFREGLPIFTYTDPFHFIFGTSWLPVSSPPQFGILPFIVGSLMVTFVALLISVPIGVGAAAFLSEIAPSTLREILKPIIEVLAGIPSIVLGFIGFILVAPLVQSVFHLSTGLNGLTAGIMLSLICLPTIISISEDALSAVPKEYKEASYALGATKWQTLRKVIIPAASPGIVASVMLGIGRAIGETMTVLMVSGGRLSIPSNITDPMSVLTARIAIEINNASFRGLQFQALFAMGIILFLITLVVNIISDLVLEKQKRRLGQL